MLPVNYAHCDQSLSPGPFKVRVGTVQPLYCTCYIFFDVVAVNQRVSHVRDKSGARRLNEEHLHHNNKMNTNLIIYKAQSHKHFCCKVH